MVTKQTVSRLLLVKLFVLIFLWTSFSINCYFERNFDDDDCSFKLKSFNTSILVFSGIANILLTINFLRLLSLYDLMYSSEREEFGNTLYEEITGFNTFIYLLYSFCGFVSVFIFFQSEIMKIHSSTCNEQSGDIIFWIDVSTFCFIGFYNIYIFLKKIFGFLTKLIKNAKICNLSYESPNDKEIQTEMMNDVVIPLNSYKNELNMIACIICMEKQIDILLQPCGHFCLCNDCYLKLDKKDCPCCKNLIKNKQAIFISSI